VQAVPHYLIRGDAFQKAEKAGKGTNSWKKNCGNKGNQLSKTKKIVPKGGLND
jgi:hypothetical protein